MPRAVDHQRRHLVAQLIIGVVLGALIVASVGAGALAAGTDHPMERVVARATTITTTTPDTEPSPAPSTLPQPDAAVAAYVREPALIIGHIQVPKIGLDWDLYQGTSLSVIDHGPSQWPGTALPGHVGNVVIAGHRITHSHPFRHMDDLGPGDIAVLSTNEGSFTYEYVSTDIVSPTQTEIIAQPRAYTATFFACHPPGSAAYRIVTHWKLISPPAPGQPDPRTLGA